MKVKFSVVIPTYNRAQQLLLTLASFEKQIFPKELFEVIVVDDKSTDETSVLVESYKAPFNFTFLSSETRRGPAAARNRGVKAAKGSYIVFCDPDFLVLPNFLEVHSKYHASNKRSVVSGTPYCFIGAYTIYFPDFSKYENELMRSVLKKAGLWKDEYVHCRNNVEIITPEEVRNNSTKLSSIVGGFSEPEDIRNEYMRTDVAPWVLFVTRCVSIKRKYLIRVGGFDENLSRGEDWELGYRLHKLGMNFIAINQLTGYHQEHPASFRLPENRRHWFEKHGFDNPELSLLIFWINMRVYKNTLRLLKEYSERRPEEYDSLVKSLLAVLEKLGQKVLEGQL